jgi:hypothetical protein
MPGRRITDYQVRRYMDERRKGATQVVAAARAGLSERSGRRYESNPGLPSQRAGGPSRRTRVDPLAEVWESEIVPMLAAHPGCRIGARLPSSKGGEKGGSYCSHSKIYYIYQ